MPERPSVVFVVDAGAVVVELATVPNYFTTSGSPHQVRFAIENHGAIASTVSISGVDWIHDGRHSLDIGHVDIEPGERPDGGRAFVVAGGGKVSVTVSVSAADHASDRSVYPFIVTAIVDGVPRETEVEVHRARREPRPR